MKRYTVAFGIVCTIIICAGNVAAEELGALKEQAAHGSKTAMVAIARSYGTSQDFDEMLQGLYWWVKSGHSPRDEQQRLHDKLGSLPYERGSKTDIHGLGVGMYKWAVEKEMDNNSGKKIAPNAWEYRIDDFQTLTVFYAEYKGMEIVRMLLLRFQSGTPFLDMTLNVSRQYHRVWSSWSAMGLAYWSLRNGAELTLKAPMEFKVYVLELTHKGLEKQLEEQQRQRREQLNPNPKF